MKHKTFKVAGRESENLLLAIVTDGWASIHNTFQSALLLLPWAKWKPEYILPAQVHTLYSHSPLQSSSIWVENTDLHICFDRSSAWDFLTLVLKWPLLYKNQSNLKKTEQSCQKACFRQSNKYCPRTRRQIFQTTEFRSPKSTQICRFISICLEAPCSRV